MDESYSSWTGLIYIFNIIVGTGALTLPAAFFRSGWVLGSVLMCFLAFVSFVTATFVVESMATSNALINFSKMKQLTQISHFLDLAHQSSSREQSESEDDDWRSPSEESPLTGPVSGSIQNFPHQPDTFYSIDNKVEMMQFNKSFNAERVLLSGRSRAFAEAFRIVKRRVGWADGPLIAGMLDLYRDERGPDHNQVATILHIFDGKPRRGSRGGRGGFSGNGGRGRGRGGRGRGGRGRGGRGRGGRGRGGRGGTGRGELEGERDAVAEGVERISNKTDVEMGSGDEPEKDGQHNEEIYNN